MFKWWAQVFCRVQDDIWFVHGKVNVLYKMSIPANTIQAITGFGEEKHIGKSSWCGMECYNDKLYIVPNNGNYIWVYDIRHHSVSNILIDDSNLVKYKQKFSYCCLHKNYLVCVPREYPYILIINTYSNKIEKKIDILSFLHKNIKKNDLIIRDVSKWDDSCLIGIVNQTNYLFKYHVVDDRLELIYIQHKDDYFDSIACLDNIIVLGGIKDNNFIYSLDKESLHIRKKIKSNTSKIRALNKKYVIADDVESCSWSILDDNLSIVREFISLPNGTHGLDYNWCSVFGKVDMDEIIVMDTYEGVFYLMDKNAIVKEKLSLSDVKVLKWLPYNGFLSTQNYMEEFIGGLDELIERL